MQVGDKVTVSIKEHDECYSILKKFNGKKLTISRIASLRNGLHYYECEGAVSRKGLPYGFCEEHFG